MTQSFVLMALLIALLAPPSLSLAEASDVTCASPDFQSALKLSKSRYQLYSGLKKNSDADLKISKELSDQADAAAFALAFDIGMSAMWWSKYVRGLIWYEGLITGGAVTELTNGLAHSDLVSWFKHQKNKSKTQDLNRTKVGERAEKEVELQATTATAIREEIQRDLSQFQSLQTELQNYYNLPDQTWMNRLPILGALRDIHKRRDYMEVMNDFYRVATAFALSRVKQLEKRCGKTIPPSASSITTFLDLDSIPEPTTAPNEQPTPSFARLTSDLEQHLQAGELPLFISEF